MKCGMHVHILKMASNNIISIRKFFKYTVPSKVTKILLVKDHARNGKEPFCVKTIESTCATLAVDQFN